MTISAALYDFFASFGLDTYEETKVPETAEYPYLTYKQVLSSLDDGEVVCYVNLFYYGKSNVEVNAKVEEISNRIGRGGCTIKCNGGYIWVKKGTPFAQTISVNDGDTSADTVVNSTINRRYINLLLEYLT